jgi:two-component system sensor histidine kinase RegB
LLRWWLIAGLACAVLSAPTFLGIPLPLPLLASILVLLAGFNAVTQWRAANTEFGAPELAGQCAVDLVALGVLLYLTGGATNPLVSLLLLPVTVAALSLPGVWVAAIATLAIALYSFLMLFSLPLQIADIERATHLHLVGMWLTFVVSAALMAWFFTRMTASIRERDQQLATAHEEALRDAQVVALGQLAAGAAHELGTPLATMSLLAGELRQDQRLPGDVKEDLSLLRQQIGICKEIVGSLTLKAGIERAGATSLMRVTRWLEGLLVRWRSLWPQASCQFRVATPGPAPQIAIETVLEQGLTNLLNNAAKIAPQDIQLVVSWDTQSVTVSVQDRGPGFPDEILRCCGAEPLPAHAEGSGIGLWLTRAAIERRGGRLWLENLADGAAAHIELPLSP